MIMRTANWHWMLVWMLQADAADMYAVCCMLLDAMDVGSGRAAGSMQMTFCESPSHIVIRRRTDNH